MRHILLSLSLGLAFSATAQAQPRGGTTQAVKTALGQQGCCA